MLSRLIHLPTSSRAAHQLLLCAQSHVCVVASSYKACVGMGERCFLCPGMHRSAVHVGSPAGSPSMDAELWVTPEQEKLSGGGQGGADTRLFYCLNRVGGRTQMALR